MISLGRPIIGEEERAAVDAVLRSGMLVQGHQVAAFEAEFGELVGGRHCIAVSSGTAALHLALLAAGIGPGDEVVVPSFTFAATANAVRLTGATAVFADIDPATFCLDPDAVAAVLSPRTAAVMPVHLYGHPAAMAEICELACRHSLLVVEDAAQAHAASLDGRSVGTWGSLAMFSFYPTKNMTTGEGGMVVTDREDWARAVRLLRNQGMERRYENEVIGFNVRMTDIAAAIGRAQLPKLAGWTATRRAHAKEYDARLRAVTVPTVAPGAEPVYHQYTVRSAERDQLKARLLGVGVESAVYYPIPVHALPAYGLVLDLPQTAAACAEVLSIPVGPHLDHADVDAVVAAVNG